MISSYDTLHILLSSSKHIKLRSGTSQTKSDNNWKRWSHCGSDEVTSSPSKFSHFTSYEISQSSHPDVLLFGNLLSKGITALMDFFFLEPQALLNQFVYPSVTPFSIRLYIRLLHRFHRIGSFLTVSCMDLGLSKHKKVTKHFITKTFILPKIRWIATFLSFSRNLLIWFFWNCIWWQALTKW